MVRFWEIYIEKCRFQLLKEKIDINYVDIEQTQILDICS